MDTSAARAALMSLRLLADRGAATANNTGVGRRRRRSTASSEPPAGVAVRWTSTAAWRGYKSGPFPAGWTIVDGVLTKSGRPKTS